MKSRLIMLVRENWVLLVVIILLVVGYAILRERPTNIGSTSAFLDSISSGKTTVVVFYSNF
jgi:hypothetical protein